MIHPLFFLLGLSVAVLAYVFVGYIVALRVLVAIRGPRHVRRQPITPSLSLVISAFNEAAVIRAKIENALLLDYPREHLDIVVVSDASDDGTDDIVREYAARGVTLISQSVRRGKTAGLNAVIPTLRGDIVVFSDANAMYRSDALLMLARNFADADVGCVTGEARYLPGDNAAADVGERVYWGYEMQVKRLETALGSMVGGDGAIYAIRRPLWTTLPDNAINDFLNPLQIVAAGWRGVYEADAVCFEETAGGARVEYKRRVRIVSRSWRAIFQAGGVLNPFRVGLFAWSVFSHKVLRWLSGVFAAIAGFSVLGLYGELMERAPVPALLIVLAAAAALCVPAVRRSVGMLGYFALINVASFVGVAKGSLGHVSGVWSTPRQHADAGGTRVTLVPVGRVLLVLIVVASSGGVLALVAGGAIGFAEFVFWSSVGAFGYVYLGYPLILATLKTVARSPVRHDDIEPAATLFITANDEGDIIRAKLLNALALDYPSERLAIVVASDGSVDGTNAIVREFAPRVRLLEFTPRRGKIAVINDGMTAVSTEIVVFSDANTFLEPDAVRQLVRAFADPGVGGVSGDVMLVGDRASLGRSEDLYYRYERWEQRSESEIGSMIGVDGALYAIRRRLFVPPASDTILDDMAIPMAVVRAGYRVIFEPAAQAYEQGSNTAREEFARKARVIAGAVQFLSRTDSSLPPGAKQVMFSVLSHKALRWLSPAFAAGAFVASLVLAQLSASYAAAALAQALVLALGIAGCWPRLRRLWIVSIAHYFCLVQVAAAVGFLRGLSGRQSVTWRRFVRVPIAPTAVRPQ